MRPPMTLRLDELLEAAQAAELLREIERQVREAGIVLPGQDCDEDDGARPPPAPPR